MIINKLYLKKFGKFENKEIEFSKGANVFFGKNEAGKSTIATALKTFFYTELNGKGKYKKSYIPLSDSKGLIDVDFTLDNNKKYKSLVSLGKTNGKTLVKNIDESTGAELEGDSSKNGELFFSLSEEMFDSVCYIKDLGSVSNITDNKADVHDKLSKTENNMVNLDLSEVIKKLKDELAIYQRKTPTGKIFPLEKRLDEINDTLYKLDSIKNSMNLTGEKTALLKEEENSLKEKLNDLSSKKEYLLKYEEYIHTKKQLKIIEEIEKLKSGINTGASVFNEVPPKELEKLRSLEYSIKEPSKNFVFPLITAVSVILASFGLSFISLYFSFLTLISAPLFIIAFKIKKINESIIKKRAEYQDALKKYNIDSAEDYIIKKEIYEKNENEKNLAIQKINFLTSQLTDYKKEYENIYLSAPAFSHRDIEDEKEKILKRLTRIAIEISTISEKEKAAFTNMPDFHLLSEEKNDITEKLKILKEEESITADCLNILNITNDSFKSSYIPYLNKEVKEILNGILSEKIDYFNINDDFICEIRKEASDTILPKENLSAGTDSLVYFAIRLAMYRLVSREEKIPLILDDCFAELDDERFEKVFKYLEANVDSQIIYFTAHERIFNLTLANTTIFRL